jgi:Rho family protein
MRAQGTTPITPEEGEAVAREIGARAYLECSSRTGQGVAEVFDEALRLCLKGRRSSSRAAERRKKKCVVL